MVFLVKFLPILFSAILGLIIGSFLNVCIYRIPQHNFFEKSRSYCPHCGHTLAAKDLVPLFSFVFLGGKCRYCKERISPQYPIIESLTSILFVCAYLKFGYTVYTPLVWFVVSALIVMSVIDIKTMEIPNGIILYLIIFGLIAALLGIFAPNSVPYPLKWYEYLIGAFCISLPFFLIALFTGGIGGGDIKLLFAMGLFLGWKATVFGAFVGILIGAIVAVIVMIVNKKKKGDPIPFGPSLAVGLTLAIFFGNELTNAYLSMLGWI